MFHQKAQTPLGGVPGAAETKEVTALLGGAPANWRSAALKSCPRLAMASMSASSCVTVGLAMRVEAKVVIVGFDWGEGGAGAGSAGAVHVRTMGEWQKKEKSGCVCAVYAGLLYKNLGPELRVQLS